MELKIKIFKKLMFTKEGRSFPKYYTMMHTADGEVKSVDVKCVRDASNALTPIKRCAIITIDSKDVSVPYTFEVRHELDSNGKEVLHFPTLWLRGNPISLIEEELKTVEATQSMFDLLEE